VHVGDIGVGFTKAACCTLTELINLKVAHAPAASDDGRGRPQQLAIRDKRKTAAPFPAKRSLELGQDATHGDATGSSGKRYNLQSFALIAIRHLRLLSVAAI
jgi:hypothetical protein